MLISQAKSAGGMNGGLLTRADILARTDEDGHRCSECGIVLGHPKSVSRHMRDQHGVAEKTYKCEGLTKKGHPCQYSTNNKSDFQNHELAHSEVRKHICIVCNKAFKRKGQLTAHRTSRTHLSMVQQSTV